MSAMHQHYSYGFVFVAVAVTILASYAAYGHVSSRMSQQFFDSDR